MCTLSHIFIIKGQIKMFDDSPSLKRVKHYSFSLLFVHFGNFSFNSFICLVFNRGAKSVKKYLG